MEPMNFFAHVQADKALVVGPTQAPGWMEPSLARILNLPADKIEIQMTRMGVDLEEEPMPNMFLKLRAFRKK